MDFGHIADLARPDDLASHSSRVVRIALVTHLRGGFRIPGGRVSQQERFPGSARQGLFDVDVLASLHAGESAGGMHVVGGGDDHGVNLLRLPVEHAPVVFVAGGFREGGETGGSAVEIDIGEGNHVLDARGGGAQVNQPPAAGADGGEVQFLIRRFVAEPG
ncbi:MAG: hypothetical protein IANPNBLG_02599 [Bryobacteraceae bacterium]|nr:hypothetical protein [Bryobacteraceae bacterium]